MAAFRGARFRAGSDLSRDLRRLRSRTPRPGPLLGEAPPVHWAPTDLGRTTLRKHETSPHGAPLPLDVYQTVPLADTLKPRARPGTKLMGVRFLRAAARSSTGQSSWEVGAERRARVLTQADLRDRVPFGILVMSRHPEARTIFREPAIASTAEGRERGPCLPSTFVETAQTTSGGESRPACCTRSQRRAPRPCRETDEGTRFRWRRHGALRKRRASPWKALRYLRR